MNNIQPASLTRQTASPVVKTPVTSEFIGDSILSLRIAKTDTTGTPAGAFPVPLFGSIHEESNYGSIQQDVPSGYSLTVTDSSNGNKVFTYSDGTNEIELTVSSTTLPYRSILRALNRDAIKVSTTKLIVSPTNQATAQFSERLTMFFKSIFGGVKSNEIEIDVNTKASDFRENIVVIPQEIKIDAENGIVVYFNSNADLLNFNFGTSNYVLGRNNL